MASGGVQSVYGDYPTIAFASIFYSIMDSPLTIWDKQERGGLIRRVLDERDKQPSLELFSGGNIYPTYITSPCVPFTTLGITLPHVVLFLKNLNRNFAFAIQIRDEVCKRRFLFSSSYRTSRIKTFTSHIPVALGRGWNEVSVDLASLTQKAYGTTYKETVRVQIHANCHLRMIYFSAESIPTSQAIDVMSGILTSVRDPRGANSSRPSSSSGSSSSLSSSPFTQLLIPPNSKPGPTPQAQENTPAEEVVLASTGSDVFSINTDLGTSVLADDGAKPGLNLESEMREIIEEQLNSLGFAKEVQNGEMVDSVNANEITKIDTELSEESNSSGKEESKISKTPDSQNSPIGQVGQDETSQEHQTMETEEEKLEQARNSCEILKEDSEEVTDRPSSPPTEFVVEREKSTLPMSSLDLSRNSGGSLLDLDFQLSELEFVVKGMLKSCPNLNNSNSSLSLENSGTHSSTSYTEMLGRINAMKTKLNKLEECFHSSQHELQLRGDAPQNPKIQPQPSIDLSSEPLGITPSGILRPPGARTSFPKLNRNLSVRFSTVKKVEVGEPSDGGGLPADSKDKAVSGGTFSYFNLPMLLKLVPTGSKPLTE